MSTDGWIKGWMDRDMRNGWTLNGCSQCVGLGWMNGDLNDISKMMGIGMDGWMDGYRKSEWIVFNILEKN